MAQTDQSRQHGTGIGGGEKGREGGRRGRRREKGRALHVVGWPARAIRSPSWIAPVCLAQDERDEMLEMRPD